MAGEGAVLVGKLRASDKLLPQLPWAPNEIVAVRGDTLHVFSGAGWEIARLPLPPFAWDVSALLDTLALVPQAYSSNPSLIALQSLEHRSPDSLVAAFLLGMTPADTLTIVRRLIADMRPYAPNLAASLYPFTARSTVGRTLIYALLNTEQPQPGLYARGLTVFSSDSLLPLFPLSSTADDTATRLSYAPRLWNTQPSLTVLPGGILRLLLPLRPNLAEQTVFLNRIGHRTRADSAYLVGLDLQGTIPGSGIAPIALPMDSAREALFLPLWVRLHADAEGERPYILLAEGYQGGAPSAHARLSLYDATGQPLAHTALPSSPPFTGAANHFWSIGVGDVDGPPSNSVPPLYPNNPGAELLVTPNTPTHAVPQARLFVLRYRTDIRVPKPQPPGTFLFPFDTITSAPCSGWLAAVGDLDGDGRAEILLADQSTLQVWRLRPYRDPRFALGFPFDTVLSFTFAGERITSAVIADVEGDGRADIVLRTTGALYCLGIPLKPAWKLLTARTDTTVCVSDTLHLRWVNTVRGFSPIRILFQPYAASSSRRLLKTVANDSDTGSVALPVRLFLPDTAGRLIVESDTPIPVEDSTAVITLRFPSLVLHAPHDGDSVTVGQTITVRGSCTCSDSLRFLPGEGLPELRLAVDSTFAFSVAVPCPPIPSCWEPLPWWTPHLAVTADTFEARITLRLYRSPARLSTRLELFPEGMCPDVLVRPDSAGCPVSLGISTDGGKTFTELVPAGIGESVRWTLPAVSSDTVWLRLCCTGCLRVDTMLALNAPLQLELLAPNPVDFPEHELQIRYHVREAGQVRLRILDAADNVVRELLPWQDHFPGIVYCYRWDGTAYNGARVPSGTYYLLLEHQRERRIFPIFVRSSK